MLLVVAIGISGSAALGAPSTRGGLHGVVRRGPVAPTCVAEQPCYVPAQGYTVTFARKGRVVARTTTDSSGRYRIRLAPARYSIRIGRSGSSRRPDPDVARVKAGVSRRVDFRLDTGIQ
jgi:Carboxypeptidase regulatory-like domain